VHISETNYNRTADLGKVGSSPEIPADLNSLTETNVGPDNKRFILRSGPLPFASSAQTSASPSISSVFARRHPRDAAIEAESMT
jgi:hypothetical protein